MLVVKGLKVHGLDPISFALASGDCLVVRGPSGCGKSLLLRAIADLDPVSGDISLEGESRQKMTPENWRRQVRYLASESGWWHERVDEHFGDLAKARIMARELGLADKLFTGPLAHLSSGERQRMAFIRAILDTPPVLLLDEPTSALDEKATDLLEKIIWKLQKKGVILLIVTHGNEQAKRLASHFLTIEDNAARFIAA